MKKHAFIILLGVLLTSGFALAQNLELHITMQPISNAKGKLIYNLYDNAEDFAKKLNARSQGSIPATAGVASLTLSGLNAGWYAFTVFHDENGNGVHDVNWVGMPKEMFGISKITEKLWSNPNWDQVKFELIVDQDNKLPILMKMQ